MAIIKSLSRKNQSFGQLYDYMNKNGASLQAYNLYGDAYDRNRIVDEFLANAKLLQGAHSQGKNYLYHEIISLKTTSRSEEYQLTAISELVTQYVEQRARDNLVFSAIHNDKDNIHAHLMISSNELGSMQRLRLSKKQFAEIQKSLEQYQNEHYPILKTEHYLKPHSHERLKNNEQEMISNQGKMSQKQTVKNKLLKIFESSKDFQEFESSAKAQGFELYTRGKNDGVVFNGKNYRLKTLGLEGKFEFESNFENKNELADNFEKQVIKEKRNDFQIDKETQELYELTDNFQNSDSFENSMNNSNQKR
jgi:hypothetical protein